MIATATPEQPTFEGLVRAEPVRSIVVPAAQVIETQLAPANDEPLDGYDNLYFVPDQF